LKGERGVAWPSPLFLQPTILSLLFFNKEKIERLWRSRRKRERSQQQEPQRRLSVGCSAAVALGVPPSLLFSSLSFLRLRLLARQKRWEEEGRAINPIKSTLQSTSISLIIKEN